MTQIYQGADARLMVERRKAAAEGLTIRQVFLRRNHQESNHDGRGYQPRCPVCNPSSICEPELIPLPVLNHHPCLLVWVSIGQRLRLMIYDLDQMIEEARMWVAQSVNEAARAMADERKAHAYLASLLQTKITNQ